VLFSEAAHTLPVTSSTIHHVLLPGMLEMQRQAMLHQQWQQQ